MRSLARVLALSVLSLVVSAGSARAWVPAFGFNRDSFETVRSAIVNLKPSQAYVLDNLANATSRKVSRSKKWNTLADSLASRIAMMPSSSEKAAWFLTHLRELKNAEQSNLHWQIEESDVVRAFGSLTRENGDAIFSGVCRVAADGRLTCSEFNGMTAIISEFPLVQEAARVPLRRFSAIDSKESGEVYAEVRAAIALADNDRSDPSEDQVANTIAGQISRRPNAKKVADQFKRLVLELALASEAEGTHPSASGILRAYVALDKSGGAQLFLGLCEGAKAGLIDPWEFNKATDQLADLSQETYLAE